jgi:hypothetical protein
VAGTIDGACASAPVANAASKTNPKTDFTLQSWRALNKGAMTQSAGGTNRRRAEFSGDERRDALAPAASFVGVYVFLAG